MRCLPERLRSIGNQGRSASVGSSRRLSARSSRRLSARSSRRLKVKAEVCNVAMFFDQLKQVVRRLRRAPMFTAITLLTLAIGVGANTVIFSVIEGVLLKPLQYPEADRLIGVWHTAPGINIKDLNMAPSIYFIDREQSTTLQDIGVYDGDAFNVTGPGSRSMSRPGCTGWHVALARGSTRAGAPVQPSGRYRCCACDGGAFVCVLAAEVRRSDLGDWQFHHHGRQSSPNHRRSAQGLPLSRLRGCGAGDALSMGSQQGETWQFQPAGSGAFEAWRDDGTGECRHGALAANRHA